MTDTVSKRYLIISPSWLGDLIMSQSLLKMLKKLDPNCSIDVYAPKYTMPILDRMEEIDHKLINPFGHGAFDLKKRYEEGKKLREGHYDCVMVLPNSLKSGLIALFAKIPDRRGFKGESRYFIQYSPLTKPAIVHSQLIERIWNCFTLAVVPSISPSLSWVAVCSRLNRPTVTPTLEVMTSPPQNHYWAAAGGTVAGKADSGNFCRDEV